jgi:acetolactate synthase-1/2/3 large subunit
MNGAESLLSTAVSAGIDVCFANPGTTEMPIVQALDSIPGVRAVLGLFEGVCTGAADGYARMTDRPALTLLHLGPGFANGIANLHNARRARTPVVNLIGDHASWHLEADAPLTSDIMSLATPVSNWVGASESSDDLPAKTREAIDASLANGGGVATLIVPADHQWGPSRGPEKHAAPPASSPSLRRVAERRIERVARRLREALDEGGEVRPVLLLGGSALREAGLFAAARIESQGVRVLVETFPARWERGGDLPAFDRLPYFPEQAAEALGAAPAVVLAGARSPVAFFGYPDGRSRLSDEDRTHSLADPEEDAGAALEALADAFGRDGRNGPPAPTPVPFADRGPLDVATVGGLLARHLPEDAVLVEEAATSGLPFYFHKHGLARHTLLSLTGGAIGQGPPCATGAAVACPDRKVIDFQADGSGLYTLQSLWTQAREELDVLTLICANRSYRILQVELGRAGTREPGHQARRLTELGPPAIDWVSIARGFGVEAEQVDTVEGLAESLPRALEKRGPRLIEMLLT